MKISCLIAAYKAGGFISKALESIRAQTHSDWEVVVVEDGSHDETESLVTQFAATVSQPVRYVNLGTNQGVAVARTRLLELSEGEGAAFLDADDWWTSEHLAQAAASLELGHDVVVSPIQIVDLVSGKHLETYAPAPELSAQPVSHLFDKSAIMTSSCVTLRTKLARRVGAFDRSLRIGEDRDYWIRCAQLGGRFAVTGAVTCFYAKHATSTMGKTVLWAAQEVAFYQKHSDLNGIPAATRRANLAHALVNYGRVSRASDPNASVKALAAAWRLRPFSPTIAMQYARSMLKSAGHRS